MRAFLVAGLALLLAGTAGGCGGEDDPSAQTGGLPETGGGGSLRYAMPELPTDLDPLEADTRTERIVARQVYEPLVSSSRVPYSGEISREDLTASLTPSQSRAEWTIVLRPGVRFHDGVPLDVSALLQNARRWIASPAGARLLPGAFGADSPRPGAVRLLFAGPTPGVPALLAAPELGLVSPGSARAGTGPFAVGPRTEGSLALVRNPAWWASAAGLGPALDSVSFVEAPAVGEGFELLRNGSVQVTEPVGAEGLEAVAADPVLRADGGRGGVAYLASVRRPRRPARAAAALGRLAHQHRQLSRRARLRRRLRLRRRPARRARAARASRGSPRTPAASRRWSRPRRPRLRRGCALRG